MPTIDQLIQQKQQEVERLQAQIEVLKELSPEVGGSTGRGGRRPGRAAGSGQRPGRARRGANQKRVLKVLSATPMRARDIAGAAKLTAPAVNQVLIGLKKSGAVEQTGRGQYRLAEKRTAAAASNRRPRRKAVGRKTRKPKKTAARSKKPTPSSSRQESGSTAPATT
jgi:hypothetical protein